MRRCSLVFRIGGIGDLRSWRYGSGGTGLRPEAKVLLYCISVGVVRCLVIEHMV